MSRYVRYDDVWISRPGVIAGHGCVKTWMGKYISLFYAAEITEIFDFVQNWDISERGSDLTNTDKLISYV